MIDIMKPWEAAMQYVRLIPPKAAWCFNITELEDDATLNIYAPEETWHALRVVLGLPRPEVRYTDTRHGEQSYEEYYVDGLSLSFITPTEVASEQSDPA